MFTYTINHQDNTSTTITVDDIDADLFLLPNKKGNTPKKPILSGSSKYNRGYCSYNNYPTKGKKTYLHRLIVERMIGRLLLTTETVDHIDKNIYNNTRLNLRLVDKRNNRINSTFRTNLVGAIYEKATNKWVARITINSKRYLLGRYATELEAHSAYIEAARQAKISILPSFNKTPKLKGTTYQTSIRKWKAQAKRNQKIVYLGVFDTQEDAHKAYIAFIEQEQTATAR